MFQRKSSCEQPFQLYGEFTFMGLKIFVLPVVFFFPPVKIKSDIFYLDTFIQYNSNITLNTRYLHWIQLNKTLTRFGYHTGSNLTVTSLVPTLRAK